MTNGLVYFVTYDDLAWRQAHPVVKIGYTTDLKKRIWELSIGSPVGLIVAGYINSDSHEFLEKRIHHKLHNQRMNGEWFKLTSDVVKFIRGNYPLSEDNFSHLFDFRPKVLSAIEIENIELKDRIHSLEEKLKENSKQIGALNAQLQAYPRSTKHELKNFMSRCSKVH